MTRRLAAVLLLATLILTGCDYATDPVRLGKQSVSEAQAFAIESQAQQDALDAEQERYTQEQQDAIRLREADIRQAKLTNAMTLLLYGLVAAGIILALGAGIGLAVLAVGSSTAGAISKAVNALTIPLDPKTHQYPLLYQYAGKGRIQIVNPNTGQAWLTGRGSAPTALQIQATNMVQVAGEIGEKAKKSSDPAAMALIRPPMILEENNVTTVQE